jgi:glucose/arabinose dehydrogenase
MSVRRWGVFTTLVAAVWAAGCASEGMGAVNVAQLACAPDNGGLVLPEGFCAVVVADDVGRARHMAVAPNGDLYTVLRGGRGAPGAGLALRDTTGDGLADVRVQFDDQGGTGIELWNGWVYVGHDDGVVRYRRPAGQLAPESGPEVIVQGLRSQGGHSAKPVEITPDGTLFVNIGSTSNTCQVGGEPDSPGQDPCAERETNAVIWRFDAETPGQTMADGQRYAAGMRNTVALHYDDGAGALYAAIHGRDRLHQSWGELYDEEAGAELPAEELVRVTEGADFGWPYCYYDQRRGEKVLAPEYGGDGQTVGRCADMDDPIIGFPGHWAPNALLVYRGDQFPERYRDGAFIAFHGSWNRAPRQQEGANVVFVPAAADGFSRDWEVFAEGAENWAESRQHRPTGLAVGPDGSLYISDDSGGRIWRVIYRPEG